MIETCYPINSLFFFRLIFMFELLLGEALFCYKFERKEKFYIKAPLGILSCFVLALIFPIPFSNAFYSMAMFFIFFLYTIGIALFLFKADWRMILFCLICGYTVEHVSYEIYNTLFSFFMADDLINGGIYDYNQLKLFSSIPDLILYLVCYINTYWIMYFAFARKIVKRQTFKAKDGVKVLFIGIIFIIIDIVLNSLTSYYSSIHYEKIYIGIISLINALACIFAMLFIFEMYYRSNLTRDLAIIEEIRKEEKKQYMVSKETIDMINIKCHDFRHQIRELGKSQNINEEAIKNVNKLINIYDSSIKTSNDTLNVILSEKSLTCAKYGITFSCIANGDLINFMSEEDIYSLFGNIIDNSIEALKNVSDDKKTIDLKIKEVGNLISVSETNYYEGSLHLINGLPKTTKDDLTHHGYGLRSIKLITEKYNGTFELSTENNHFVIALLFIKDEK